MYVLIQNRLNGLAKLLDITDKPVSYLHDLVEGYSHNDNYIVCPLSLNEYVELKIRKEL